MDCTQLSMDVFCDLLEVCAERVWYCSCCCREEVDRASDERECEAEILAEVSELQAESREDYERKVAEYKTHLEEWKTWKKKQVRFFSVRILWTNFLSRLDKKIHYSSFHPADAMCTK